MAVHNHGGGCCGMRHSVGYSFREDRSPNAIYKKIRDDKESRGVDVRRREGRLIEVVVTDNQLRNHRALGPILTKEGFRLVNSFRNSNTENICRVFHFIEEANLQRIPDISSLLDANKAPEYTPPPPPQPRWQPILSLYHRGVRISTDSIIRVRAPRSRHHLVERPIGYKYHPRNTRYYYIEGSRFEWYQIEILAP